MREKLIELVEGFTKGEYVECRLDSLVSSLIANGVTFATDNNVGDKMPPTADNLSAKWIPVTERLPEQGQEVIVYSGGVLKPTVFAYQFWNKNYDSWARITHWMPLPEPPKGE